MFMQSALTEKNLDVNMENNKMLMMLKLSLVAQVNYSGILQTYTTPAECWLHNMHSQKFYLGPLTVG